jgi:hypothetical protein
VTALRDDFQRDGGHSWTTGAPMEHELDPVLWPIRD